MSNKWEGLSGVSFDFVDLGRPAAFLLPVAKLQMIRFEKTLEDRLHNYLVRYFGAFTFATIPNFGVWIDSNHQIAYDECRLYEVSFMGKERVTALAEFLSDIAVEMNEECLYFKAGQYAALIYPRKSK